MAATHALDRAPRRAAHAGTGDPAQSTIDFLPNAPLGPRKLKTTVEAVIYCNDPVAAPLHRSLAAALDASMIFIGFGVFSIVFHVLAGTIAWNAATMATFAAAFVLITLFYGVIWAMFGRETPGMHWTQLRLINFDGCPPDGKSRALRIAGSWLSFCSGTIGLLWAIVDEENLTWHDHMSKTFPTLRESNSTFFQQR